MSNQQQQPQNEAATYPDPQNGEVMMPPVALIPRLLELRDILTEILMMLGIDDLMQQQGEEQQPTDETPYQDSQSPQADKTGDAGQTPDPYSDYNE